MPRTRKARSDPRSERTVEDAGDRFMHALGFTAIRFSQPRNTMQTPGIPDRRYYNPARNAAVWWEAKTEIGRPSGFQVAFRLLVEAVGEEYLIGTDVVLHEWAVRKGWVERLPNGFRIISGGSSWRPSSSHSSSPSSSVDSSTGS